MLGYSQNLPTVLLIEGFAFKINTKDHTPPHTHIWKSGLEVRLTLEGQQQMGGTTMRPADVRRAQAILTENLGPLWEAWKAHHG